MNDKLNVLFLGGAKRVSLAEHLIDTARRKGLDVEVYSYELDEFVPIASVGTVILGLRWKDENIIPDLLSVIREKDIHIVLPFVDPAVEIASRLRSICSDVFIPVCREDICKVMFDKQLSVDWFKKYDIPVPQCFSIENIEFPAILKPRTGSASKGIKIVYSRDDLRNISNLDSYVIQTYIQDGIEFSVDCYVSESRDIVSIVPRIRLEVAGGEVINTRTIKDDVCITLSRKVLQTGQFIGPVTIQFIRDVATDKTYIMEINPRLGGGVIASIEAGANILSTLLDEYLKYPVEPIVSWKENTFMTRYFKEVIFYADNH